MRGENMKNYVIGLDYGSDSVRALLVDAGDGSEIAESVFYYPRWKEGKFCDPAENRFRQHPLDYLEGLEHTIKECIAKAGDGAAEAVRAIALDTTGSTLCAVDDAGQPLALSPEFAENPNAMFVLWKDHTAIKEAAEINALAHGGKFEDFTRYVGGIYSSEWFFAKILHVLREDASVGKAARSWVEHCDWIPAVLSGNNAPDSMVRFRCSAGHKAMWHPDFDGLPSQEFLSALDPLLDGLRDKLYQDSQTAEKPVGTLCPQWAEKLGLSTDVIIGGGAFDCHFGAVGGEIHAWDMVKVMGTSTCDIVVAPEEDFGDKLIRGICGQVDGSVIPGMVGLEAGQSAFGDVYAWFKKVLLGPVGDLLEDSDSISDAEKEKVMSLLNKKIIPYIEDKAEQLPVESSVIALDWINGRRTPDANQALKGAVTGLQMGTDAYRFYKALVDATCFGARKIQDRFIDEGVELKRIIAIGGVARKSSLVMQTLADVLNREILVSSSDQACALGSAMFAAVAGGLYENIESAQKAMGGGFEKTYKPIPENAAAYEKMYQKYSSLGSFIEAETGSME